MGRFQHLLAIAVCGLPSLPGYAVDVRIDSNFPGGNILVDEIAGDVVRLRPDLRDTDIWWFYWSFRVRGAAGRTLTFQFADKNPIGVRGPAISTDGGATWAWLGAEAVRERPANASFQFTFPPLAGDVRFAFTIPYQESDLRRFIAPYVAQHRLSVEEICKTPMNRTVELLRIAPPGGHPAARAILTARHHACETMASFVLEGLLAAVLQEDETGGWLREHVEFLVVPMVDKDGVEAGDQGKNRAPHDHWLDYTLTSRYPAVAAIRRRFTGGSEPPVRFAMDMHCSFIREASDEPGSSEHVFFMNSMLPEVAEETNRFQRLVADNRKGPIPYTGRQDLPFGVRWNTQDIARPSFLGWASHLPDVWVATVLEVPYANAGGAAVTPESARALGSDIAGAMRQYFAKKLRE